MKKNFFKKLSLGLALALVVGTTAQAGTAKAAETWALKQASKTLYLNKEQTHDFDFKKLPTGWKDLYSFEWTTGNTKVATVAKGGVVTPVSVGETTVNCTVTEKGTDKVVATAESKVVVKANAADVKINNVETGYVAYVGESIDLNRTMYDENGNATTKRGVYVTDYSRWSAYYYETEELVDDEEVVAIDQKTGTFTMKQAGAYVLVVETYQSKANSDATAADAIVVVVESDFAVAQNKDAADLNVIDITFAVPVAKDDFKLEEVAVNAIETVGTETIERNVPVNKTNAVYDKDGKFVTGVQIVLWNKLVNNKTYEVTYGTDEEAFVASVGAPKYIEIEVAKNGNVKAENGNVAFVETAGKVENNTLTVVYRDANGVNVTKEVRNGEEEWILNDETGIVNYDQDNKTITASKDAVGKSFNLVIKYSEINSDGDSVVVAAGELDFYVDNVTDVVLNVKNAGIVKNATATPGYDKDRKEVTKVAVNDEGIYFAVSAYDAWGNTVGNSGSDVYDLRFELSDPAKGYIDESTGEFQPFVTGWVYVNVFYTDKTLENPKEQYLTTKAVYVQADRVPGKLSVVDKASASLTANVLKGETVKSTNIVETATFYFTLGDNYGETTYTNRTKADFTFKGVSDAVIEAIDVTYDTNKKAYKLTVTNTELIPDITNKDTLKSTTVTVKITVGSAEDEDIAPITFSVSLKKPVDAVVTSYKADIADINIATKNSVNGAVDMVVYGLNKNGVKVEKITSLDGYLIDGDIAAATKADANGVVAAEALFAGAATGTKLVYTITEGKNVVKATGNETATVATGAIIKVNGQVMEGFVDGIVLVDSIEVPEIGNVTYHAQAGKYTVTVYQITKTTTDGKAEYKYVKKCSDDFTVTNSLNKIAVAQDKTTTTVYTSVDVVNNSKLAWTYNDSIKNAVTECFTFKLGDAVVDNDALAFQVRVAANGKSVYVKSVKVFKSVDNGELVAYTVDVNKTIYIGE